MSTVYTTQAIADAVASAVSGSDDIADLARERCGRPLTVYLDGLPADRSALEDEYPILLVTGTTADEPLGGPARHTVRALLLLDAASAGSAAGIPSAREDGVRVLTGGEDLADLADAILSLLRDPATALGSRVIETECELDLVSQWPLRTADLTINCEDTLSF